MTVTAREALERASELLTQVDDELTDDGGNVPAAVVVALGCAWSEFAHAAAAVGQAELQRVHLETLQAIAQRDLFSAERERLATLEQQQTSDAEPEPDGAGQ